MKHLYKSLAAGLLASTLFTTDNARAAEFDLDSLTYTVQGYDAYPPYYSAQCRINLRVLTRAHPYGRDAPSNYDYFKVKIIDGSGTELASRFGSRYGTYANPRWILWRTSIITYPTPNTNGPLTLQFFDTDYARTNDTYQDEVELDAQTLIDAGGGCADLALRFNTPPVAMAGEDIDKAIPNRVITLDGTASFDEDGDTLTYSWTQIEGPEVALDDPTSATPSFTYPPGRADQILAFALTVNDGQADSEEADTVIVTHNGRSHGQHSR